MPSEPDDKWDFDGIELPTPAYMRRYLDKLKDFSGQYARETGMGFCVGDSVRKKHGVYAFDSIVVSVFRNRAKEVRLVCESDLIPGLLHIFSPNQMELIGPDDGQLSLVE